MQYSPLLTAEEEFELASRNRAGDESARQALMLANLRLVRHVARRLCRRPGALDDLVQEGSLGLIRAARDFDPARHRCRFYAYAEVWIKGAILGHFRRRDRVLDFGSSAPSAIEDLAGGVPADAEAVDRERRARLDAALEALNPVEAWVIRERYGVDLALPRGWSVATDAYGDRRRSVEDLALECGLSRRRFRQIEEAALEKIRRRFAVR